MTATDPIDKLVASGISVRTLIPYFLVSVEWLSANPNLSFRLCYYDDAGEVVVEAGKGAAALLKRASELGWTPNEDEPTEQGAPCLFQQTMHHVRRGVHWYSTATDETDDFLPLGFPAAVLEAAKRRHEIRYSEAAKEKTAKAALARIQRAKAKREKVRKAEHNANHAAALKLLAKRYMEASEILKDPITIRHAMTLARKCLRDCNDGDYTMHLDRGARARAEGAQ